jgi:serine phosphatase RsbU (regulator of sigma subunit)
LVERVQRNNTLQKELAEKHDEITAINEEIRQQGEQIEQLKARLEEQLLLVTSSINYAQHIQNSILPDIAEVARLLPDSFVFFKPKDIVSGDYYWVLDLSEKFGENICMLGALDCTGHGVPGAFMSFLGITYLQQIVDIQGITDVSEVFNLLNLDIAKALRQGTGQSKDGMEGSLCLINQSQKWIDYVGARGTLFYIEEASETDEEIDLQMIHGNSYAIGGGESKHFKRERICYRPNTIFYLSSDGYRDQFGSARDKKFMMKNFKQLLLDIHQLPIKEQSDIIKDTHEKWRGSLPQTDDILVVGFRLE